ncbi:MAG: CBS domain-containing protein [Halobacteriales archaeon]
MRVEEVMTSPVVTVGPGATLRTAVGAMLDARVGSVVVTDGGPAGILTRSDALRAAHDAGAAFSELTVSDAVRGELITVGPRATVEAALRRMDEHGVKKLPVTDGVDLVGIVTATDVAEHLPGRVREVQADMERRDDWTG